MKSTTPLIRAQMRRTGGLERIGPAGNSRTIAKTPLSGGRYLLAAALMILIFLATPFPARSADIGATGSSGETSEYCSTDTPMPIPDNDTITSQPTISDTGPIVDLNVRVSITHTSDGNLDIFLIAPDGTRQASKSRW